MRTVPGMGFAGEIRTYIKVERHGLRTNCEKGGHLIWENMQPSKKKRRSLPACACRTTKSTPPCLMPTVSSAACATRTARACWRVLPTSPALMPLRSGTAKRSPAKASCGTAATTSMTSSRVCGASATALRKPLTCCFWATCPPSSSWPPSPIRWSSAGTCPPTSSGTSS